MVTELVTERHQTFFFYYYYWLNFASFRRLDKVFFLSVRDLITSKWVCLLLRFGFCETHSKSAIEAK